MTFNGFKKNCIYFFYLFIFAGLSPKSGVMTPRQTPGTTPLRTPVRDKLNINPADYFESVEFGKQGQVRVLFSQIC